MEVKITQDTTWQRALNEARRTVGKAPVDHAPSYEWRRRVIMAEHSQIKLVEYTIMFKDLRQWVGVHLLRHEHLLPFVHSQRVDRRADIEELTEKYLAVVSDDVKNVEGFNRRDYLPQGQPNDQDFVVNVQTLINISRKRLCGCASKETREAWRAVRAAMVEVDPVVAEFMVPNCIYRGFCPEMVSCGYWETERYAKAVQEYRDLIKRG